MSLNMIKPNVMPIGVDLGSSSVKAVQLRRGLQGLELVAAGSLNLPADRPMDFRKRMHYLGGALRDLLKAQGFRTRLAVLSLPADVTVVEHVKLPKSNSADVGKALRWELASKLPFPPHKGVIRHLCAGDVFGDGEPKQEMIAVGASNEVIHAVLAMARRAKLDVVGLNVEPVAIAQCFGRVLKAGNQQTRPVLFVDMGASTTQVVLANGERITFARNLPIGGAALDQAVSKGLGIPLEKAHSVRLELASGPAADEEAEQELLSLLGEVLDDLTQQLTQCIRYHESVFRKQSIERVIFLGGQAYNRRLCQAIAQRLNLPAQVGDPLVQVLRADQGGSSSATPRPEWAVAVGLSLGGEQAA